MELAREEAEWPVALTVFTSAWRSPAQSVHTHEIDIDPVLIGSTAPVAPS